MEQNLAVSEEDMFILGDLIWNLIVELQCITAECAFLLLLEFVL